ncbi:MAG: nucleotidyltransferase family protein [Phycisphaerae bacterium]|nr:nucleotidyltransferase family protein [Phycisphaerae bacterium]
MVQSRVEIPTEHVADFCRRWRVRELALFGSVLTERFGPESDVDVLVTFAAEATWSLFDLVDMEAELHELFGRPVHLVEQDTIRDPFRRQSILAGKEVIYAA